MKLLPNVNEVANDKINVTLPRTVLKCNSPGKNIERHCFNGMMVIDVDARAEKEQKKKRKEATVPTAVMNTMGHMQELNESLNFLDSCVQAYFLIACKLGPGNGFFHAISGSKTV
jgi:hypothetical protein